MALTFETTRCIQKQTVRYFTWNHKVLFPYNKSLLVMLDSRFDSKVGIIQGTVNIAIV